MILPRLAKFKTNPLTHVILVTGEMNKSLCSRKELRNGQLTGTDATITCRSCHARGWIHTIGNLSGKTNRTPEGRYLTREEIQA